MAFYVHRLMNGTYVCDAIIITMPAIKNDVTIIVKHVEVVSLVVRGGCLVSRAETNINIREYLIV